MAGIAVAEELSSLFKEILRKKIERFKFKFCVDNTEEDDLDDIFLGFTEEELHKSLENVNRRKQYQLGEKVDSKTETCCANLTRSELLIKSTYIGNHCHNCQEVNSEISIPIDFTQNEDSESKSSVDSKKIVLKVYREKCLISVNIPENLTISTANNRKPD